MRVLQAHGTSRSGNCFSPPVVAICINKKPGIAGLFVDARAMRANAPCRNQVNKVCGYSGLRSRASNSFKPASGVISPCSTARTALEIGSSMP